MAQLNDLLNMMVDRDASDMFFTPDTPLHIKVDGVMTPVSSQTLTAKAVAQLADAMMSDDQRDSFDRLPEMNLGLELPGTGRFRVNIFRQRGDVSIVIRYLKDKIPSIQALNLPDVLENLIMRKRGLVLVVGPTGSGKSTTLASMINYRNQNATGHILTIEDPIEYVHRYKKSVVNQREVGIDTLSYDDALKNAMREAPDVILIGEIRDAETMMHAVQYAETGHLCLSTLHASNANHALERVISFFPQEMHRQLFLDMAHNLAAIVSQRLVRNAEGKRMPAVEVMMISPFIRDLIRKGEVDQIRDVMEKSEEPGMQTFDQSLFKLYKQGQISKKEALAHAESVSNLGLQIRLDEGAR
ncbi:MAG: PilT/PilU family type 4a pilus ATPase [bacterium]